MNNYTFTIPNLPGGMQITCSAESQKDAIREAHFWQSLPTVCPIDGTPTIFCYREPKDNSYYSVISTGFPQYEYKIGQHKNGITLFAKEEWVIYDGEKETVVWNKGKLTPAGERLVHKQAQAHPTQPSPAKDTPPPSAPSPPPSADGPCPACHAPAGKPHASTCTAVAADKPTPPAVQDAPPTGANAEFDRLPGHGKNGHVPSVTDHQKKRIAELVVELYGPDWAADNNEAKMSNWASDNTAETFATLSKSEAQTLLDLLVRRSTAKKQKETAQ